MLKPFFKGEAAASEVGDDVRKLLRQKRQR